MATYYVRPDGNDTNTGLGSTTALAWRTVQKALGATGIGSGDTVYIAPGTYTENITVGGTYSAMTSVIGDVLCTQFTGLTPGFVKISNYTLENLAPANTNNLLNATSKSYLSFDSIYFQGGGGGNNNIVNCVTCNNFTWTRCIFQQNINYAAVNGSSFYWTTTAATASNLKIRKCVFVGHTFTPWITGVDVADTFEMSNCLIMSNNLALFRSIQGLIINCTFYRCPLSATIGSASFPLKIRNTIVANVTGAGMQGTSTAYVDDDYNRVIGCQAGYSSITVGPNSKSVGTYGLSLGFETIVGLSPIMVLSPEQSSPNVNSGTNTDSPVSDIYGATWTSTSRDIGDATVRAISGAGVYIPTERNASVMSMQAGSTSRSIYLYLGATSLTTTTAGLQAYYTKEDGIPVSIPLVAQTPTGAWVAGGFAEVSAINQPGIYRLDIPDAAISAGYSQTVVMVRGASGTNGAVVTIQDPPERGSAIYMGPYKLISNHMGADNPLEVLKGVQAPVDLQLVDNSGGGVDITGATVTAKIYNASSQLIDTYTCTPTYALDGRCSFNLDTTVTDNSGHYTVTVTRQVGGNIVVFGPLRCLVRAN